MVPAGRLRVLLGENARTFALVLRFLPDPPREPIALAYLLARASDSVADAPGIPRERRLELLQSLSQELAGEGAVRWSPLILPGELSESERRLMEALPWLLDALARHPERREILRLWEKILEGQLFDLERFVPGMPPLRREELEHYCGMVAGSVGETWTRLVAGCAPGILLRPLPEMLGLGRAYGKGLQLVNVLRDRAEDRKIGRVYAQDADLEHFTVLAREWLGQGGRYIAALRPGRVRMASGLPLALAIRTLDLVEGDPSAPRVKLSRMSVFRAVIASLPSLGLGLRTVADPAS